MTNYTPSYHLSVFGYEGKERLRSTGGLTLPRGKFVNLDSAVLSDYDAARRVLRLKLCNFDMRYWRLALLHIAVHFPEHDCFIILHFYRTKVSVLHTIDNYGRSLSSSLVFWKRSETGWSSIKDSLVEHSGLGNNFDR